MSGAIAAFCLSFFGALAPASANDGAIGWVPARNGAVANGAFAGGNEQGRTLYVCRARYQGGLHPGKIVGRNCNIGWGGREILRASYEVMVTRDRSRLYWAPAGRGGFPPEAVVGGSEPGRTLYICRARYRNGNHPGKVVSGACNIGWGGREIVLRNFEVLASRRIARSPYRGPQVATYSFGLANGTPAEVDIYVGQGSGDPAYVGTLAAGSAFSRDARAGDIFFFSQNGQWIGSYRVDDQGRRQLLELPSGAIHRFN